MTKPLTPLVFFGTPAFAVPTLAALVEAGLAPTWVVTQPSRPVGRGGKVSDPPVAAWARQLGLAVRQPEKVRAEPFASEFADLAPAVAVVVAFGQIFPRRLLEVPPFGCVNLHASLLPRYRGAAPIQAAVAAGDPETGVTTMLMGEKLDAGPILLQETTPIGPRETAGELAERLATIGARLMVETLRQLAAETLVPRPQDDDAATFAGRLHKEDGVVDWSLPAIDLVNRLRAFTPWPGLTAWWRGQPLKLLALEAAGEGGGELPVGTVLGLAAGGLRVAAGGGTAVVLGAVQKPGKKPISGLDFANGERLLAGERFGAAGESGAETARVNP